jgi:hypothetical protein
MTCDKRAFDKTFQEYMKWTKKQPAEIINSKLYFITLNAINYTKKARPGDITNELNSASQIDPRKTLGEVLVIRDLKRRGKMYKKTSTLMKNIGSKVEKMIARRVRNIGFLATGWFPAIKKLDFWNRRGDLTFTKRFAPKKPIGIKKFGKDKGDVVPAREFQSVARGTIFNYIGNEAGKDGKISQHIKPILQQGLDFGVRQEILSMRKYIELKYNQYMSKHMRKK